ncbi:MAG: transcription factor S [DPANN group archaeon]|nr:transcription factor S [DPANN group archaeon]
MQFCPKCKGILMPTKEGVLCSSCGHREASKAEMKETVKRKPVVKQDSKEIQETMPTMKADCPKCGNKTAYWFSQQTRAADEPETQFFICTKCGQRWRKY